MRWSTMPGCQAGIRAMKEKGGAIVNISSIAALAPSPKMAAYGASKAAVAYLCSSESSYVTGSKVVVDGGISMQ